MSWQAVIQHSYSVCISFDYVYINTKKPQQNNIYEDTVTVLNYKL